ncbi:MAG: DUF2191 domain-containing protein [Proteobacteria bacterium]|nr:DUF2191 domain-containing protein [Pseudomonadota bacterium]
MRTTLTIDDSLMDRLKEEAHRKGLPLKQVVNEKLELGLRFREEDRQSKPYRQKTFSMGCPPAVDFDKSLQLASELEDDEIVRELEMRK